MTLFAPESGSSEEAIHHIEHILKQATAQHLSQMNEAKAKIELGDVHEGGHIIENMLAGIQIEDLTPSKMHTGLARSAALIGDAAAALHHLSHLSDSLAGDPSVAAKITEIKGLLESGQLDDAAHELEELVGSAHEEEHSDDGGHGH